MAESSTPPRFESRPLKDKMGPELRRALGQRISRLRREHRMTQGELGSRLGLGQWAVSTYERGENAPRWETILRLGEIFSVDVNYLMTGKVAGQVRDTRLLELLRELDGLPPAERTDVIRLLVAYLAGSRDRAAARAEGRPARSEPTAGHGA